MCIICDGGNVEGRKVLYVSNCTTVTAIPVIEGLKILLCNGCTNLKQIPLIEGLEQIVGYGSGLEYIPDIKTLIKICVSCTPIKNIPVVDKLHYLNCSYTNIKTLSHVQIFGDLHITGCRFLIKPPFKKTGFTYKLRAPWYPSNPPLIKNISDLIIIQKWIRRTQTADKLIKIKYELAPIYHHPDMKGGYFAKKDIMDFYQSI